MKVENEIDIKACLVYVIALICAVFGKIDWIVAILFILSNITFRYHFKQRSEKK